MPEVPQYGEYRRDQTFFGLATHESRFLRGPQLQNDLVIYGGKSVKLPSRRNFAFITRACSATCFPGVGLAFEQGAFYWTEWPGLSGEGAFSKHFLV